MHSLSAGPEKIAASCHALSPDMSINTSGLEITCELRAAVRDAGGGPALRRRLDVTPWKQAAGS